MTEALHSVQELEALRAAAIAERERAARDGEIRILVHMGSCSIAAGAREVMLALQEQMKSARRLNARLVATGCGGLCALEPVVQVLVGEQAPVTYGHVTPEGAARIFKEHVIHGVVVQDLVVEV